MHVEFSDAVREADVDRLLAMRGAVARTGLVLTMDGEPMAPTAAYEHLTRRALALAFADPSTRFRCESYARGWCGVEHRSYERARVHARVHDRLVTAFWRGQRIGVMTDHDGFDE